MPVNPVAKQWIEQPSDLDFWLNKTKHIFYFTDQTIYLENENIIVDCSYSGICIYLRKRKLYYRNTIQTESKTMCFVQDWICKEKKANMRLF